MRLFLRGATLRPCVPVALVVGSVLTAANEGRMIASGQLAWPALVRIGVNYLVPFLVSGHGFIRGGRMPA